MEGLLEARALREAVPFTPLPDAGPEALPLPKLGKALPLRAVFHSVGQLCPEAQECKEIALPIGTELPRLKQLREDGWPAILLDLPRAVFGWEEELRARMEACMAAGFRDFLCGNLGAVQLCRELGARAHGSFSLNIANSASFEAFADLGLSSAELSFELTGREAQEVKRPQGMKAGLMVYGRQALMLTRNCPLANSPKGCLNCREPGALKDRKGARFPVLCRERGRGGVELLNSVPLWLGDLREELPGDFGVLRFTVERPEACGEALRRFQNGEPLGGPFTRGLFRRGVE